MAIAAVALAAHSHRLMTTNLIFRHFCVDKRTNKMVSLKQFENPIVFQLLRGLQARPHAAGGWSNPGGIRVTIGKKA
jgi:hypothetical protein